MSISAIFLVVLVVVLLSGIIAYTILVTSRPSLTQILSPSQGTMSVSTKIGTTGDGRDRFLTPSGATLMVYIFCMVNDKTQSIGRNKNPITLLRIGDTLQLQILPGGVSTTPKTQLAIKTQNPNPSESLEVFEVEDFPQQRWVHVAIVREGRRYTIYYNGKVSSSQRTKYYPTIDSSSLKVGDPNLIGEYTLPKIAPTPYSLDEIKRELGTTSDTRYQPYKSITFADIMATFSIFSLSCPNGIFCFTPSNIPESPLKVWKSPYA
jgi:hypothetical protein